MTARERAELAVQAGFDSGEIAGWGLDDGPAFEARVAAAIRSAEAAAYERALTPSKCPCGSEDVWVRRRGDWEETLCRRCNLLAGCRVRALSPKETP